MSGGHFNYDENRLLDLCTSLRMELDEDHSEIVKGNIKYTVGLLDIAYTYLHRIDHYLSGDDSEDSFVSGLYEDMKELEIKYENDTRV